VKRIFRSNLIVIARLRKKNRRPPIYSHFVAFHQNCTSSFSN